MHIYYIYMLDIFQGLYDEKMNKLQKNVQSVHPKCI